MLATQHSMEISLRWTRRWIVIILIVANLMTVVLADAASATSASQSSFPNAHNQQGFRLFIHDNRSTDLDAAWQSLNPGEADIHTAFARAAGRKTRVNTRQSIVTTR